MITQCIDYKGKILLSLRYDSGEWRNRIVERTQAVAASAVSADGVDGFEAMSATEDNAWMLQKYIDAAWHDVKFMCSAYLHCGTIPDSDEVTPSYNIVLLFPHDWSGTNAVSIDDAITEFVVATALRSWWISKNSADHADVEHNRILEARSKIKMSINHRLSDRRGRAVRWL